MLISSSYKYFCSPQISSCHLAETISTLFLFFCSFSVSYPTRFNAVTVKPFTLPKHKPTIRVNSFTTRSKKNIYIQGITSTIMSFWLEPTHQAPCCPYQNFRARELPSGLYQNFMTVELVWRLVLLRNAYGGEWRG